MTTANRMPAVREDPPDEEDEDEDFLASVMRTFMHDVDDIRITLQHRNCKLRRYPVKVVDGAVMVRVGE